jgi:UDP-2,4-diacetamido-2,4,6-trideoxy-beta-L-altropyranose hydrolase
MTQNILVIDDLANRPHDCDLLLDQNLLDPQSTRYQGLAPTHCQQLLGPRFALLRPEFIEARASMLVSLKREQPVLALTTQRLLIFFGGSDPTQECFKALEALRQLPSLDQLQVDLVAGASNPQFEALQQHCQAFPQVRLHKQSNAMSDLMAQADLALGAGGTTSWERLCLGLPSIIIAVAENQVEISQNLAEGGYHIYLGESKTVSPAALGQALGDLLTDAGKRQALCVRGMALVDGMGVHRVVERMYAAYR